eukprot:833116-Prorocentrum_lima.AAC.1
MTSSLVGSEMCIRDRAPCAPGPRRAPAAPACPEVPAPASPPAPAAPPVSYTHLTLPTICSV